ncbi:MAG: 2-oxo acid dehydrogenase subunit E2 [Thermoplasmatales archaeon]|nr:2-oxo acid dehydrogenase subunit E2 [Thermoplasmatales archaeon]
MKKRRSLIWIVLIVLIFSSFNISASSGMKNTSSTDIDDLSFKQKINIPIDTSLEISKFQPIDIRINFKNPCWALDENHNSIRIAYDDGSGLIELESQIYDLNFTKKRLVDSCSAVFLIPEYANGNEKYFVVYDSEEIGQTNYYDYISLEDSHYYFEPIPGQKIEFDYYGIIQDEFVEYAVMQKGEMVGNPASQFVARLKPNTKQVEISNVDQIAVFDMRYGTNSFPDYYGTSHAKKVNKNILVDGNLMVRFKIEAYSPDNKLKTDNIYTYYYCPTDIKRLFVDVNHEVLDSINIEDPSMFDGSYAGIATTETRSNTLDKMNFGDLLPNIHVYDDNENVKSYLLPRDPSESREYILSTDDDIDLGSKAWLSLDDTLTGKAHGLIMHSNTGIVEGGKDGVQVKSYVEQNVKLPGMESDSGSIYFMRNSYERGERHNTVLSKGLNVHFGVEFISANNEGFQRIDSESEIYQKLYPNIPIKREDIEDDGKEEERYSLTVYAHNSPSDPFGPVLSTVLGIRVPYTSVEIYKEGNIQSSGSVSRLPLKAVEFDLEDLRFFQKIRTILNVFDWKNLSLFKKISFPNLEPGVYVVKVFRETPSIHKERRFIGVKVIDLREDSRVNVICRTQASIHVSAIDQNDKPTENVKLLLEKDGVTISESTTDVNGSAIITAPYFQNKHYNLKVMYQGFIVEEKMVALKLINILIPLKKQVSFKKYSLSLSIKDKWGFSPEIEVDPVLTSHLSTNPIVIPANKTGEGKYRFDNLIQKPYDLEMNYKGFRYKKGLYLDKDETLDLVFPAEYQVEFNVMNSFSYDLCKGELLINRNDRTEKILIEDNGNTMITVPPGKYGVTIHSEDGKILAKQDIQVRGDKNVNIVIHQDSILHIIVTYLGIALIIFSIIYMIKKRKIFAGLRLIIIALILIALVSSWWTLTGQNDTTSSETNTYLIPSKIITTTTSTNFVGGELGHVPSEVDFVLSTLSYLLLISLLLILIGTFTGKKFKKTTGFVSILGLFLLFLTILVYYITLSQITDVTTGVMYGEGNFEISIPGSGASEILTSTWGPGIGFYLIITSFIILIGVTNDRLVEIGKFKEWEVKRFPKGRDLIVDGLMDGMKKHRIHSFVELDVTKALSQIEKGKKKGKKVSFTGWIIKCIAQAVSEHKQVHAIRLGRRRVVVFDDVDVSVIYDRTVKGESMPMIHVIRDTNKKNVQEITREVRSIKARYLDEKTLVAKLSKEFKIVKLVIRLPRFIRKSIWKKLRKDPFFAKKAIGTVMVSSLGMIGKFPGWTTTIGVHPLFIAIFGTTTKQRRVGKRTESRKYLSMTISFDHEVLDGVPYTRFLNRLTELIENAYFLDKI